MVWPKLGEIGRGGGGTLRQGKESKSNFKLQPAEEQRKATVTGLRLELSPCYPRARCRARQPQANQHRPPGPDAHRRCQPAARPGARLMQCVKLSLPGHRADGESRRVGLGRQRISSSPESQQCLDCNITMWALSGSQTTERL